MVVGPLVSAAQRDRVEQLHRARACAKARRSPAAASGRRICRAATTSSRRSSRGARNDMAIAREEIFGPVITAIPFRDEAEAIAHRQRLGLRPLRLRLDGRPARGLRVARALRTGTVQINGEPDASRRARSAATSAAASDATAGAGRSPPTAS